MRDPSPRFSSLSTTSSSMRSGEKHAERAIFAAIRRKSCPICLENLTGRRAAVISACKHGYCVDCIRKWSGFKRNCPLCNTGFDSWFIVSDLASRIYRKENLPLLRDRKETVTYNRRNNTSGRRRIIQRSQNSSSSSRSTPLPWRRSFGRPGSVSDHVILERKLRWRASIYDKQLRVVPCLHSRPRLELGNDHTKAKLIERVEPWIRRELQAVLRDPDPTIIVHFASALFIKRLESESSQQSGQIGILVEEEEASSLRKFLFDKEDIFWHELRCFAESSLTMETYDAVVEYNEAE